MWRRFFTLLRHHWLDAGDTRRVLPAAARERLAQAVVASEAGHSGEIRIHVEASLPASYLWRHLLQATPIDTLARQRARMMFSRLGVWDTQHNNGVLIYLMLAERRIEIVADRGVDALAPAGQWQQLVQAMAAAFAEGRFEQGLLQAVQQVDAVLRRHFPRAAGSPDSNELPDQPSIG